MRNPLRRLTQVVIAGVWIMAGAIATPAAAGYYPMAPPGTQVFLQPWDFLKFSPDCQPCNTTDGVVGDNLERHPGALWSGPDHFIGVFGHDIRLDLEGAALYLWESSSGGASNHEFFAGPDVQLGNWNGVDFLASGIAVQAWYRTTGVRQESGQGKMIFASLIPLDDFQVGRHASLNAVRISARDDGHNQVIAVAVTPEPAAVLLILTALGVLIGTRRG
jgi:hypothetical protein